MAGRSANKARGRSFEGQILRTLTRMVDRARGCWGAGLRRREARGGTQDCDVLFGCSLGGAVIECKSKQLKSDAEPTSSATKFYLRQAIAPEQVTRLLNLAIGSGFTPLFAFEYAYVGRRGCDAREAYLVHGEAVLRYLLEYSGITQADIREVGLRLERAKLDKGDGKSEWVYGTTAGAYRDLVNDYAEAMFRVRETAVFEWCERALDRRREESVDPASVPNIRRLVERVRGERSVEWLRGSLCGARG